MANNVEDEIIYTKIIYHPAASGSDDDNPDGGNTDTITIQEVRSDSQMDHQIDFVMEDFYNPDRGSDNIWSVNDYALRDLLVHLVRKYRIDEVYDSKIKATNWEKLIEEFHQLTENRVTVSKPQIVRKWHNWKQYNKTRRKPHPFNVSGNVTEQTVKEKCDQLCERAKLDPEFAALLARGPLEAFEVMGDKQNNESDSESGGEEPDSKHLVFSSPGLCKLSRRDFLVRRTGASAAALSLKRLQHEITLEKLCFEREKWKIKYENNHLVQQKLQKQSDVLDIKIEKARHEFNFKREQCLNMGIIL